MLLSNSTRWNWRVAPTTIVFACGLAVAIMFFVLPQSMALRLRGCWRDALAPGQRCVGQLSQTLSAGWRKVTPGSVHGNEDELRSITELKDRLERLEAELLVAKSAVRASEEQDESANLLLPEYTRARVLGRQATAFLRQRDVLDVGRARGVMADALVIDVGRDAELSPARTVVAGGRIWGKIAEVGGYTSTVRRLTDAGFSELVQLAKRRDGRLEFGARGVLVGNGNRYCKLEQVRTSEFASVGDLVFTTDDSLLEAPLIYGTVVKVERVPPGAFWEIWVAPAIDAAKPPASVAVLKYEMNPARIVAAADRSGH